MFTKEGFEKLKSMADVLDLSPMDFEYFCKFFLESIGYQHVFVTEKFGEHHADGGVDIRCELNNQKVDVQCKKWGPRFNNYMKIAPVRELGGCMLRDKVPLGVFIGLLGYDANTKRDAVKMSIRLIDGDEIANHMRSMNPRFNPSSKRSLLQRLWRLFSKFIRRIFWL